MHRTTCSLLPALLLLSATAVAAPARLLPPAPGDLASADVVASDVPSSAPAGGPAHFTWPIDQAADDLATATPHRAESIGHTRTLTRAALARGVAVAVSQPGALLKLSPRTGAWDPGSLVVVDPRGAAHRVGDGLHAIGPAEQGAVRLDPRLGAGTFTVRAAVDGDVHLDVRERGSDIVLAVQADRDVAFAGDSLSVQARVVRGGQALPGARIGARLVDPRGRDRGALARRGDALAIDLPGRTDGAGGGALWTVEVTAELTVDGLAVRRTTTTAIAVTVPTARFTGSAELATTDGVRAELELDVASPGRYAATAVLHGTNREGALQPIAVAQSADVLAPGRRHLALQFDAATITASGMRAPFELRDLRLADQGRMSVLHRQARGLPVTTR